jgi:hypothetical protein
MTHTRRNWLIVIFAAALIAFAAKVIIARYTYGSLDAVLRELNLIDLRREGAVALYQNGTTVQIPGIDDHHHEVFNHPPFIIRVLSFWGWLADISGLPLRFWDRFTCSLADLLVIGLFAAMMRRPQASPHPGVVFLAAISPVSLMISGFHCNVDPIMVAFVLLSVYLLDAAPAWLAGMSFGMAMNLKVVPLIFVPALFLYLGPKKRLEFFLSAAGVFVAASAPILFQHPLLIWQQVFGYNPLSGAWGISRVLFVFASDTSFQLYSRFGKIPVLLVIVLSSIWMRLRDTRPRLEVQFGLIAFLFLALSPGFGVQYLAWLVPWTCCLTFRQALAFHLTAGLFLFSFYYRATGGFPWDLAYSGKPEFYGSLVFMGLCCWACVCWLAFCFARILKHSQVQEARIAQPDDGLRLPA